MHPVYPEFHDYKIDSHVAEVLRPANAAYLWKAFSPSMFDHVLRDCWKSAVPWHSFHGNFYLQKHGFSRRNGIWNQTHYQCNICYQTIQSISISFIYWIQSRWRAHTDMVTTNLVSTCIHNFVCSNNNIVEKSINTLTNKLSSQTSFPNSKQMYSKIITLLFIQDK